MEDIVTAVAAKISEYLVKPILIRPLRPIFCFRSIGDDFLRAKTELEGIKGTVHNAELEARNNARAIDDRVTPWLAKVNEEMPDVERMEIQLRENSCSWCPSWTWKYNFSKRVLEKTNTVKSLCEDGKSLNLVAHPAPLRQHIVGSSSSKAFVHCESSKSAFDQIMEALEKDGVNIIGLYGETGMGKTMMAKEVAKEAEKQFEHVVMVNVSKNQELRSIQGTIAEFLNMKLEEETVEGRASRLRLRLERGEKILLILDDVWKDFDFEAVGIPSANSGCKILLTAHSKSDVPDGLQTQRYVQLGFLPEDEAWDLVQSIAGISDEVRAHDGAKNAIAECKGRPKFIMTLGRALRGKSLSEWDEALEQLHVSKHKVSEELEEQAKKLSLRRKMVKTMIKTATDNAEGINEEVDNWLIDVEKVMNDKEQFMNEFNESRYFFDEHGDKTKAEESTVIAKKLLAEGDFDTVSYASPLPQVMGSSFSTDFMFSLSAKSAFNQILEALQKDDVNIIGLYGMGGIGKTTLAEQVQKEVENFKIFNDTVMITVSQRPDLKDIQKTIAESLNLKLEQETKEGRARKLSQRFKDGKILVILDDIWQRFDLKTIGITLDECKGCKVLLTTRRKKVCDSMDCQTNIQLNLLSEDEAREFFRKKACLSKELKLNVLIEEIVRECKGLPIALATVGSALRNTGEDEWREALDKLRYSRLVDIDGVDDDDINAYKCLRVSYDYLTHSAEAQEKQIILLLCSLYPEDMSIKVEALSRYVFGMRLFHRVKSVEDARRKVRVTIRFLKESCLLLDVLDKDVVREDVVKMHDVVRDAMLWIGGSESLEKNVLTVRDESDLKEFIRHNSFQNCSAVSFMAESVPVLSKYDPLACPNLETIMIFGGEHEVELSNEFFQHMTSLKVFHLETTTTRTANGWINCRFGMPQSLYNLTDLRALMLDYCVCSNSLILRELTNVEILSLKESEIDCGVEILSGLKELRLLDLSGTKAEGEYPSNMIDALSKLEELRGFVIRKCRVGESSSIEWELPSNLVALSVGIEDATCIPMGFCFPKLATYFIRVGRFYANMIWSSPSIMRCLELEGIEDESAMINICKQLLPTVAELRLEGWKDLCSLPVFTSHAEGLFQTLKILEIEDCNKMERVFEFGEDKNMSNNINTIVQLQFLKALRLIHLDKLKHVWKGSTRSVSLRNLTEIEIWYCSKLTCVFPSPLLATTLQQLEYISISHCDDLEEIISWRGDSDGKEEPVICFKKLKTLHVSRCGKLKTIFPISAAFPKLERLELEHNAELEHVLFGQSDWDCTWPYPLLEYLIVVCPKLCTQFVAACIQNLSTTKHILKIEIGCNQRAYKEDYGNDHFDDNDFLFSFGETLSLRNIAELKCILQGPTHNICFANLSAIEVIGCHGLKHIFAITIARTLSNLKKLIIRRCNELEQVITGDDDEKDEGEDDAKVGLESLEVLDVSNCEKLKTVFSVFTPLPKLKCLRLERNAQLESLFGQPDCVCTSSSAYLETLSVTSCPKFIAMIKCQLQPRSASQLCEFDDAKDEDDDSDEYDLSSPNSFCKLLGVKVVKEV